MPIKENQIFNDLFVLEMANNHWGSVDRGIKIINSYGRVVRENGVRAAIKLQFRDPKTFIHNEYKNNDDIRYINKTNQTFLSTKNLKKLIDQIKKVGALTMSTPFDEKSVETVENFDLDLVKIASADITDWPLIEKIGELKKPTIVSTGGAQEIDLDNIVKFFANRNIPLALNHCISLYPTEDSDLALNQITYLRDRYPKNTIGFSSHEYNDWSSSMLLSFALGARTWERHIDIDDGDYQVSKYCSLPNQIDEWFKSYFKAKEMLEGPIDSRRSISKKERTYLDSLARGIYAKRDIKKGYKFSKDSFQKDFYLSIPLNKGQISCNEIINDVKLTKGIKKDEILSIFHIDGPYSTDKRLRKKIENRGYKKK
ncbi:N-acetylneuraminate synthase family protein [bacterium]|nr:N-acetylneuraminate synthase family protein [bacterium]|tara:strand:+ start:658 stop:1767 length:1110 start_codon:yes stop_codon:yes gene_type:complete